MRRNKIKISILILFLLILELTACSSNKKNIVGKYINIFDKSNYIVFNKDGSFIDNFLTTTIEGNTSITSCYIYQIDDSGLITIIDTTEYEGENSLNKYEMGWLYKNYIGTLWNGMLPIKNTNTVITCILNDFSFEYNFKDDKTYEYNTISKVKAINTETGTYSINGNEVICTSSEGEITTFINIDGNAFCIEYIKQN